METDAPAMFDQQDESTSSLAQWPVFLGTSGALARRPRDFDEKQADVAVLQPSAAHRVDPRIKETWPLTAGPVAGPFAAPLRGKSKAEGPKCQAWN